MNFVVGAEPFLVGLEVGSVGWWVGLLVVGEMLVGELLVGENVGLPVVGEAVGERVVGLSVGAWVGCIVGARVTHTGAAKLRM